MSGRNDGHDVDPFASTVSLFSRVSRQIPETYIDLLCDDLGLCSGDRALELGCGSGELAARIAVRDIEIDAIDRSRAMIQAAASKSPLRGINWQCVDVVDFPMQTGRYSAVYSYESFHLFSRPRQLLARIKRALRSGGTFGIGWHLAEWEDRCSEPVSRVFEHYDVPFDDWGYWLCPELPEWLNEGWNASTTSTLTETSRSSIEDIVSFLLSIERTSRIDMLRRPEFEDELHRTVKSLADDRQFFIGESTYGLTAVRVMG